LVYCGSIGGKRLLLVRLPPDLESHDQAAKAESYISLCLSILDEQKGPEVCYYYTPRRPSRAQAELDHLGPAHILFLCGPQQWFSTILDDTAFILIARYLIKTHGLEIAAH
jgi:hypothetical protein